MIRTHERTFGWLQVLAAMTLVWLGCAFEGDADIDAVEHELLTPNLTAYAANGGVVVEFTEMSGGTRDWISIASPTAPINGYVAWAPTSGTDGSVFIYPVPPGTYEARAHYDQTVGTIRQRSEIFVADSGATITPDSLSYVEGDTIQVSFTGVPPSTDTWFVLAPAGSTNTTVTDHRFNTTGAADGSVSFFAPTTPGTYVVRCFRDKKYLLVAESVPFTVDALVSMATVTPPTTIEPGAQINIAFSGFPNSGADWVAIANVGAAATANLATRYPVSGTSGVASFQVSLAPGTYEARGYFDWNATSQRYVIRASALFVVSEATTRASVSSASAQGNGDSTHGTVSSDGRYVAFSSRATNLVPGDTNGVEDVFLRDRVAGTTQRVSVATGGIQANGTSAKPVVSDTGQYVVFSSRATNLAPDVNGSNLDIFVHDISTGTTDCASLTAGGDTGNGESFYLDITPDGRFVVFHSAASDLVAGDTNGADDIFVRDRTSGTTERVSVSDTGAQLSGQSLFGRISDDGRYISFVSNAIGAVAAKTTNRFEVFVRDRVAGTTTRITRGIDGLEPNADSYSLPEITSNGRFVVFASWASNLVSGDTNGVYDLFRWDRTNNTLVRVNVAADGSEANARVFPEGFAVSSDGRFISFSTAASNLVAADTGGHRNVFRRDVPLSRTVLVSPGNAESRRSWLTSDGRRVVFESAASNLVADDTNMAFDVFVRFL